MAIMETKIIQVKNDPAIINDFNETWGHFGWSTLSVQITHSQNTRTYTDPLNYGTGIDTVETTTINYATITYQRDKSMEGYRRLVELEQDFFSSLDALNEVRRIDEALSHEKSFLQAILTLYIPVVGLFWVGDAMREYSAAKAARKTPDGKLSDKERAAKIRKLEKRLAAIVEEADFILGQ